MLYGTVRIFLFLGARRGKEVAVVMAGIEVHHQKNVKVKNAIIFPPPGLVVITDRVGETEIENLHQGRSHTKRLRSISTEEGNTLNHYSL